MQTLMLTLFWLWLLRCVTASKNNSTEDFVVNDFIQVFQSTCGPHISPVETCAEDLISPSTSQSRISAASLLSQCYTASYKSYTTCSTPRDPSRGMSLLPIHNVGYFPEMKHSSSAPKDKPTDIHGNATCARFPSFVNVLREACGYDLRTRANADCCKGTNGNGCKPESFDVLACGIQSIRSYIHCTAELSSLSSKNSTHDNVKITACVKERSERITWVPLGFQVEQSPGEKCGGKLSMIAILAYLNVVTIAVAGLGNWRFWRMVWSKLRGHQRDRPMSVVRNSVRLSSPGGSGSRTPPEMISVPERRHSIRHHHLGKIEEEVDSTHSNDATPPSLDIEAKAEDVHSTTSKVEDFPSRGNSTRADRRRRHSALMQGKNQKHIAVAAFRFSFLMVYLSIALQILFNVGIALLFRHHGLNVVLYAQFAIWCLRPRSSFFIGVMGLLDAGWMGAAVSTMISDIFVTALGALMVAMSGIYNMYPRNPAKPGMDWNIFNVGAVLALLPTAILFLTILCLLICIGCVIMKQFKHADFAEKKVVKLFLVPWFGFKTRSRIAWKWLLSSCTTEKKVGSLPAARFTSWVKVAYYGLMGCSLLVFIANWTFWLGFLGLHGQLYCPQDLGMVYIMGFGLSVGLTISRVIFEL